LKEIDLKDLYLSDCENYCNNLLTTEEKAAYYAGTLTETEMTKLKHERISNEMYAPYTDGNASEVSAIKVLLDQSYNKTPTVVKSELTQDEVYLVKSMATVIPGIFTTKSYQRVYPYGNTMQSILGSVKPIPVENREYYAALDYNYNSQIGSSYIESELEQTLSGIKLKYKVEFDDNGFITSVEEVVPGQVGNDVKLTIDMEFQQQVDNTLTTNLLNAQKNPASRQAKTMYAVVNDPNTGQLLAVSGKTFNGTEVVDSTIGAFTSAYEIGSTTKVASLLTGYTYGDLQYGQTYNDTPMEIKGTQEKKS